MLTHQSEKSSDLSLGKRAPPQDSLFISFESLNECKDYSTVKRVKKSEPSVETGRSCVDCPSWTFNGTYASPRSDASSVNDYIYQECHQKISHLTPIYTSCTAKETLSDNENMIENLDL